MLLRSSKPSLSLPATFLSIFDYSLFVKTTASPPRHTLGIIAVGKTLRHLHAKARAILYSCWKNTANPLLFTVEKTLRHLYYLWSFPVDTPQSLSNPTPEKTLGQRNPRIREKRRGFREKCQLPIGFVTGNLTRKATGSRKGAVFWRNPFKEASFKSKANIRLRRKREGDIRFQSSRGVENLDLSDRLDS